jgi:hypothetical protein
VWVHAASRVVSGFWAASGAKRLWVGGDVAWEKEGAGFCSPFVFAGVERLLPPPRVFLPLLASFLLSSVAIGVGGGDDVATASAVLFNGHEVTPTSLNEGRGVNRGVAG